MEGIQLPAAGSLPELTQHNHQPVHHVPSHDQPVPDGQQQQDMHSIQPNMPPHGPRPGAEHGAVPQAMMSTWQQLDAVMQAVRRMEAWIGLHEDALVPSTITQRLAAAVELVTEASEMMEQGLQGLGGEPAVMAPGPALPPQLHEQVPPAIGMSMQDGWDPLEAAREGRLDYLQRLQGKGRFLDLHSPQRAAAGEARRAEAWLAALAACKAGHAHVLRWLFRGDWPRSFDADPPWHLRDMAESWLKQFGTVPQQGLVETEPDEGPLWRRPELACFPIEVELYCSAMRAPACLDALLEARARSAWICRAAVLERRADLLRLAMACGCPCDAWCLISAAREGQVEVLETVLGLGLDLLVDTTNRLFPKTKDRKATAALILVLQAGMEAAARGQEACLEALLRWHHRLLCGSHVVAHAAARAGSLNCLQLLHRAGFKQWGGTTQAAASRPDNLPCLLFAWSRERHVIAGEGDYKYAMTAAARAGSLANLTALHEAGLPFTGWEVEAAIKSSNLDAVRFCLGRVAEHVDAEGMEDVWLGAIITAINESRNPGIMQLLYESGYPTGLLSGKAHPAVLAIVVGVLEWAQIAVKYSGVPQLCWLDTRLAARGGEALLRYVHGLGGTVHEGTAEAAARWDQVGALRYAIQNGATWDESILVAAIGGDSLRSLRYVLEGGCPPRTPGEHQIFPAARSLPVLRYVCERMGPIWRAGVLRETAMQLAVSIRQAKAGGSLDWQMALYTVQQFLKSGEPGTRWGNLPAPLADAVLVRRERAAALAGVFFKAGQLGRVHTRHSWAPLWRAMAAIPCDLRERIAFKAHLVLPPATLW